MFVVSNLIVALAKLLDAVMGLYCWVIIAYVLLSWVGVDPWNPVSRMLDQLCRPVLWPFRKIIPPMGGLDLSPVFALLILYFLRDFLVKTLFDLSLRLAH